MLFFYITIRNFYFNVSNFKDGYERTVRAPKPDHNPKCHC